MKVTENMLGRLQSEVDWSSPGAKEQATGPLPQMAFEGVEEYLKEGDASLGAYRDKERPTFIEEQFDGLLASSPYVMEYVPELHRYLDDYPQAELPGVTEFLYWSTVKFGLKPTTRVNHVVFYRRSEANGSVAIASKMLYASHYFHTALELKYLVRDTRDPSAEGFYLLSFSRSRSDGLTGMFGGMVRSRAQSLALDGLESGPASLKRLAEQGYGGSLLRLGSHLSKPRSPEVLAATDQSSCFASSPTMLTELACGPFRQSSPGRASGADSCDNFQEELSFRREPRG